MVERIRASLSLLEEKKTIIYLGDGVGDFCPTLKLGDGDYVMPRKNFPVWDLICKNRKLVKAQVCEWSNGEEFEQVLLHLVTRVSIDKLHSADCKLQRMPAKAPEAAFSKALSVLH